jgi:IclR family acetate operon transcriptional repressor
MNAKPAGLDAGIQIAEDIDTGTRLRTVDRALSVLEFVAEAPREPSIKEVARGLGLNLSACYHVVNTLESRDYLMKGQDHRLRLGPRVATLYNGFTKALRSERDFLALLQDLRDETNETTILAKWDRGDIVMQQIVEGKQTLRVTGLYVGQRSPAHTRTSGKVVLAFLPVAERDEWLRKAKMVALTPNSITDRVILRRKLEQIARTGFAIDEEEFALGICGAGAPYFLANGVVAGAVTVAAPASRFRADRQRYARAVLGCGERISRSLGYAGAYPPTGERRT